MAVVVLFCICLQAVIAFFSVGLLHDTILAKKTCLWII
jgi:hypothetical protein